MNVALLTTDTPHHCLFLRDLSRFFPVRLVVNETAAPRPPFETAHPFEAERELFEFEHHLQGDRRGLRAYGECLDTASINDPALVRLLAEKQVDVLVSFGVSRIKQPLLDSFSGRIINLHGGDAERYRGLDTHLWAILHNDFEALVSSLHTVDAGLDTGPVILKASIPLRPGMFLHELRATNTLVCVDMTTAALGMYSRSGRFLSYRQRGEARYYSYMPSVLKARCVETFERHTAGLAT